MFDPSVSAHRALPSDEIELLREHLLAAGRSHRSPRPWRLAANDELQSLQGWGEEFSLFGREVTFRAADAAIGMLEAAWHEASRAHPADEVLAAIAAGNVIAPQVQLAAARAWLAAPSETAALDADATLSDMAGAQLDLDAPEFDPMRERPFVWLLIAARDLVALTNHPQPESFVGRILVAAAAAPGGDGAIGVARVQQVVREALEAWLRGR